MHLYFKAYEIYYNNLLDNQKIVSSSKNLSSTFTSLKSSINNSFKNLKNSHWNEKGKSILVNQILSNLSKETENLAQFISNNLVMACDLSINTLLRKLQDLKTKDEELYNLNESLIPLQSEYNSLKSERPNFKITDEITGNLIENPAYNIWETKINVLVTRISEMQKQIQKLIADIEILCNECNQVIADILALNGDLSKNKINELLPVYSTPLITFIDVKTDFENEFLKNETPITIEQLLADTKCVPPLLPFYIDEQSIRGTKDGGIRFTFEYQNDGIKEKGIMLLPPNTTKNNKDVFVYYSGSGGIYIQTLDKEFNNTNPPYPMIAFGRDEANGGMVNELIQDSKQIDATTNAAECFRNYLGGPDTKIHAIGHSIGAIELNQIVVDKPNFFETATFINGRIRYVNDQNRLDAYQNISTKLNAIIGTEDKNVEVEKQLNSYNELVDININCYHTPIEKERKKISYGNNKTGLYNNVLFEQTETGLPKNLNDDCPNLLNKKTENKTRMDLFFIEGAGHTGFLPSCLPNQEFYNLILKTK